MAKKDTDQYTVETFVHPSGVQVTVRHPILTPEERKRREDRAKKALCHFYEEVRRLGLPWPGDPGYEEYMAEQQRRREEAEAARRKARKSKVS